MQDRTRSTEWLADPDSCCVTMDGGDSLKAATLNVIIERTLRSITAKFVVNDFQSRWSCGNANDVPALAGLLVHYSHLLFDIPTVIGKLLSISRLNASFAASSIKLICIWAVICPEDFAPPRGSNRPAATAALKQLSSLALASSTAQQITFIDRQIEQYTSVMAEISLWRGQLKVDDLTMTAEKGGVGLGAAPQTGMNARRRSNVLLGGVLESSAPLATLEQARLGAVKQLEQDPIMAKYSTRHSCSEKL